MLNCHLQLNLSPLRSYGLLLGMTLLSGCNHFIGSQEQSLPITQGAVAIKGLAQPVQIKRNALGSPLIQAANAHDLLFSQGFLHADQRLEQMMLQRAMAYGTLAEIQGPKALPSDYLMRSLDFKGQAQQLLQQLPKGLRTYLEVYARGVNAQLYHQRQQLADYALTATGSPAYWRAEDSLASLLFLGFSLAGNLNDELTLTLLTDNFNPAQLAALVNSDSAESLTLLTQLKQYKNQLLELEPVLDASLYLNQQNRLASLSSSQWAQNRRPQTGKSLLVSDWHANPQLGTALYLSQWQSPELAVAGFSLPGFPSVLAGSNQRVAYSFASSNADNQDLFIERLALRNGRLMYLEQQQWRPAQAKIERFIVKGQTQPLTHTFYRSPRGPLLHNGLVSAAQLNGKSSVSLQQPQQFTPQAVAALFKFMQLNQAETGLTLASDLHLLGLEMLFADAQQISWQTTGSYPSRGAGRGLFPVAGWEMDKQWLGLLEPSLLPYDINPASGALVTANNQPGQQFGLILSNQGNGRYRAQRIEQLLTASQPPAKANLALFNSPLDISAQRLQHSLQLPHIAHPLKQAIEQQAPAEQAKSRFILQQLQNFDGLLAPDSIAAAIYSQLLATSQEFLLQSAQRPLSPVALQGFQQLSNNSTAPALAHLLQQDNSPFWPQAKGQALAELFLATHQQLSQKLGSNSTRWQLHRLQGLPADLPSGSIHTLNSLQLDANLPSGIERLSSQRLLVDFSLREPLLVAERPTNKRRPEAFRSSYLPFSPSHQHTMYRYAPLQLQPK
ncbi:penicillin acylase family protein [Thiopseudomonas alkaliphila]|uniref:penicillin acylase family protein n=1 Tax=Thiopseudomonas alkaliphila TaxID=1697053 RepID=UPI002577289D|nr:penicillin acylase family protein [Thiopseudomonas alkaliphila]MDM1707981.1 penicillin acylase family protein [Thiopseudomonas alkaliphila]